MPPSPLPYGAPDHDTFMLTWGSIHRFHASVLRAPGGMMRNLKLGTNVTVFLLFFGISLLDAVQSHAWLRAGLWFALGLVFLRADALARR
jgi:hypothetical protein